MEQIQKLLDVWRTRKLTLQGKILVLKTIALPKIIYPISMLSIPDNLVTNINKLFFNFLWGRKDKIKRLTIIDSVENGGLNMIDIESHVAAIKASWVPRIFNDTDNIWKKIPKYYIGKATCGVISSMSFIKAEQFPRLGNIPEFYQEVILGYCKANHPNKIKNKSDLYNTPLWGNRLLLNKGKCLFSNSFIKSGIKIVSDILLHDGRINPTIYNKLETKSHYFQIMADIIVALKPYNVLRYSTQQLNVEQRNKKMINQKCKWFYNQIVQQKYVKNKSMQKWSNNFGFDIEYKYVYHNKIKDCFDTKLAEFHYKLFCGIIACGYNLYKWKKIDSSACNYCGNHIHNEQHMLIDCPYIHDVWDSVKSCFDTEVTMETIVIGHKGNTALNFITTLISFLLYKKSMIDRNLQQNERQPIGIYLRCELSYRILVYVDKLIKDNIQQLLIHL